MGETRVGILIGTLVGAHTGFLLGVLVGTLVGIIVATHDCVQRVVEQEALFCIWVVFGSSMLCQKTCDL